MIPPLFRRPPDPNSAVLYRAIVAQARQPAFYADLGVPDTVLGRFDMVVLHTALLLRRLRAGEAHTKLSQGIFDAFCADMDGNLREMGISDQGVPRQMKRVGEAFYGRARAYDTALAQADDGMLVEALARNVYAEGADSQVAAMPLAAYVRRMAGALEGQEFAALARGAVRFPEPEPLKTAAELKI